MIGQLGNATAEELVEFGMIGGCSFEIEGAEAVGGVDEIVEVIRVGPLVVAVSRFGLEGVLVILSEDLEVLGVIVELGDVEELLDDLLAEAGGEGDADGVWGKGGEFVREEGFELGSLNGEGSFQVEEGGDDGFCFEMLKGVWLGDDVEEDVEVLILGGRGVVESVVDATGKTLFATDAFMPMGEGGDCEDFGQKGFEALFRLRADNVDIDGESFGFGEVEEQGGASFEDEVEGGGGEGIEEGKGEDGLFEDEGIGSGEGFTLGVNPLGGVAFWRDHERGVWMPPRWRRWAELILRRSA